MSRYIDVDKINFNDANNYLDENNDILISLRSVNQIIKSTPTADVVEVVRCRDCIYYQKMATGGLCMCGDKKTSYAADFYPKENDFCSYGERKDGE